MTNGFLEPAPQSTAADELFDSDVDELGFVMNRSRLWAFDTSMHADLFALLAKATAFGELSMRHRGVLVAATAAELEDSYCSLAWGMKLAKVSDAETAAAVITGVDGPLSESEQALARWARAVVRDPTRTTSDDVGALRQAGFSDAQIFAITVFVSLRLAFATVNDSLGVRPDAGLRSIVPDEVQQAVTYGRPIDDT